MIDSAAAHALTDAYVLCVEPASNGNEPLRRALSPLDVDVRVVSEASVAWRLMSAQPPELVLLDDTLPDNSAFALLERIRRERSLARIPVVLQTATVERRAQLERQRADAAFYMTKPISPEALLGIVRPALRISGVQRIVRPSVAPLTLLRDGRFEFRTIAQAHSLALELGRLCPDPERASMGLGELMVNAIEHGNLEIGYLEKAALCRADAWQAEVERRLQLPQYIARLATLSVERRASTLWFELVDAGAGFDWEEYLRFDPRRAQDPNGRGIALANNVTFSSLCYHPPGNKVIAVIELDEESHEHG